MKTKVCIIGAGPAGLMAAIFSAGSEAETTVVEANPTAGRKLLRTGRGRCNLTHTGGIDDFIRAYGPGGRFLRHCLYELSADKLRQFFSKGGLDTKAEKNGCVFPVSDQAKDVKKVLLVEAEKLSVRFMYGRRVEDVEKCGDSFTVRTAKGVIFAEKVIIATGGVTWPGTGSMGDGYRFAQKLGHTVAEPKAALVPLVTSQSWPGQLAGIGLGNVRIAARIGGKKISMTGEMLFTHDGIGGPVVFNLSRLITDYLPNEKEPIEISIDLMAEISEAELEKKILEQITEHPGKAVANILAGFLHRRMATVLCGRFDFDGQCTAGRFRKEDRKKLVRIIKHLPLSITATRPIAEATVTRGGVRTGQIDPKTMQSRICRGLFFAGEVIDVDGPCGGYNLQICWSTGALAGSSAGRRRTEDR
jgi:predicted Rossmann fold flavoprotein